MSESNFQAAVSPRRRVTAHRFAAATPRAVRDAVYLLLVASALVWLVLDVRWLVANDAFAWDFLGTLWEPAVAIREGVSPYPDPSIDKVDVGNPTYYPPLLIVLVVPLTLLPWAGGAAIWGVLLAASVISTLLILGVRDLRCHAVALITVPVLMGLMYANATLLLLPLMALGWRHRDSALRCGGFLGLAIAAKLILWPVVFWQLGTRRYKAAAVTAAVATAGIIIPWALIDFHGMRTYPDLIRVAQEVYALHGLSVATVFGALGLGTSAAVNLGVVFGVGIGAGALLSGRAGRDEASFFLAILAAIVASPVVWEHYFAFLLVPLAIAYPKLSLAWMLLPLAHFARLLPRPRLSGDAMMPGGSACCPPDGVPLSSWIVSHAPSALWPALAMLAFTMAVILLCMLPARHRPDAVAVTGS